MCNCELFLPRVPRQGRVTIKYRLDFRVYLARALDAAKVSVGTIFDEARLSCIYT